MERTDMMEKDAEGVPKKKIIRPQVIDDITGGKIINGRGIATIVVCYTFMSAIAIACLVTRIALFGRGENFCRIKIIKPMSRLLLKLIGIKVEYPEQHFPSRQVIYTLNHSSTMDNFLVTAMGLSDTRYFLSWKSTFKVIPLTITSLLQGTFYTPSQQDRPARVRCFQNVERVLMATGFSTILSPEGQRVCTGEIGPFNKGAFHLATNLKVPIVPVYFYIPHHINPWATFYVKPGEVTIELLPMIDTSNWTLDKLDEQRELIRNLYVDHHDRRHRNDHWY